MRIDQASKRRSLQGKSETPLTRSARRRLREREHRLETILKAAGTLFAEEGYHRTGMERIADEAEVSVGTVYFYFKNKEDLLVQLLDRTGYELRNLLGDAFRHADGTLEGFRSAGKVFFEDFCPHNPEKIALIFRESAGQSAVVEAHRKRIFARLIEDLKAALASVAANLGAFHSDLAIEVMAASILGMFERLAYHYLIWQDRRGDLAAVGEDAVDFIVGGIRNLLHTEPADEEN
ncbi:MAG: TetR/AcrR family transcriptional regulator [Desulfobacterales bacterium]|nr:TetR/AcrR family transcriptional regulator [Desulfobacterales bacterium]MDJ0856468.1 TetR/AcrR family transcriptional regulator [Desulfobacterales bacterium]MDJ0886254.1 TetR/AcrR family transcriptional regulator [Desulfobacterales bacterium]